MHFRCFEYKKRERKETSKDAVQEPSQYPVEISHDTTNVVSYQRIYPDLTSLLNADDENLTIAYVQTRAHPPKHDATPTLNHATTAVPLYPIILKNIVLHSEEELMRRIRTVPVFEKTAVSLSIYNPFLSIVGDVRIDLNSELLQQYLIFTEEVRYNGSFREVTACTTTDKIPSFNDETRTYSIIVEYFYLWKYTRRGYRQQFFCHPFLKGAIVSVEVVSRFYTSERLTLGHLKVLLNNNEVAEFLLRLGEVKVDGHYFNVKPGYYGNNYIAVNNLQTDTLYPVLILDMDIGLYSNEELLEILLKHVPSLRGAVFKLNIKECLPDMRGIVEVLLNKQETQRVLLNIGKIQMEDRHLRIVPPNALIHPKSS